VSVGVVVSSLLRVVLARFDHVSLRAAAAILCMFSAIFCPSMGLACAFGMARMRRFCLVVCFLFVVALLCWLVGLDWFFLYMSSVFVSFLVHWCPVIPDGFLSDMSCFVFLDLCFNYVFAPLNYILCMILCYGLYFSSTWRFLSFLIGFGTDLWSSP
jgi:hypothetical protein